MKREGKVLRLFLSTGDKQNPRKEVQSLQIDQNGILNDKFYAKDENRAILVSSTKSYTMAMENGITIEEGVLGENIYIDIDPYSLIPGESIFIGDVELVVTQNCTLCKGLSSIDSKLPKLLKDDRGIFTKAKKQGKIYVGDKVRLGCSK